MKNKKIAASIMFSSLALLATSPFMMNAPEVKQVNAATVKDLSEIISFSQANFLQNYIGDYFVDFNLSERIFPTNNYINDHQNSFLDENGSPINIADGILINGQTLTYWINYSNSRLTYPRNEGVHVFPISAGGVYNPVSVEITGTAIAFKFNLEFFPMDSIVITFKAGVFKAYYNGTTFNLSEDLTFRSTLSSEKTTNFNKKITFVKTANEVDFNGKILTADDRGEKTSPNGGKYHQYLLWTNIPRNSEYVSQPFATDNDRYIHDNILINGATITSYNTWARGNSKDFTNLNDPSTQNSDYETGHPTGSANVTYDLAVYTQMATDQPNYVFEIKVPNQLVTDLSLGTVAFSFREGSAWYTLDKENNFIVGRHNPSAITAYGNEKKNTLDNLVDVSLYRESEQITIAETIADAETAFANAFTKADIDASFENAKNTILALKTDEEKTKEETIDVVVNLIDEIPDQITYTKECYNKIKAALEAYIALTNEEQAQVPSTKVDEMYNAYSEYQALDLANYKDLTITTINEVVNVDIYYQTQKETVIDLKTTALTAINNATNRIEVDNAYQTFITAVSNIKTAITLAYETLDNVDLTGCTAEQITKINQIIINGKMSIDLCQNTEQVDTLLNRINAAIEAVKQGKDVDPVGPVIPPDPVVIEKNTGIPTGALIGAIAGGLVLAIGLGIGGFFLGKKKK